MADKQFDIKEGGIASLRAHRAIAFAFGVVLFVLSAAIASLYLVFGKQDISAVVLSGISESSGGGGLISQTITFGSVPSISEGGTGTVRVTTDSGLPVTFTSATPSVCTISGSTVRGVVAGVCTIIANQTGNATYSGVTAVTQILITVSAGGGDSACAGVPVPASISDIDISVGPGVDRVAPDSGFENYAVKSYRFTTTADKYGQANFGFEDTTGTGDFFGKLLAISTCPGDFTGIGVTAGSGLPCYKSNSSPAGGIYYQVGATGTPLLCKLDPNTQYYLNIKNSVRSTTMKYLFFTHPAVDTSP